MSITSCRCASLRSSITTVVTEPTGAKPWRQPPAQSSSLPPPARQSVSAVGGATSFGSPVTYSCSATLGAQAAASSEAAMV